MPGLSVFQPLRFQSSPELDRTQTDSSWYTTVTPFRRCATVQLMVMVATDYGIEPIGSASEHAPEPKTMRVTVFSGVAR
jgi:hypothetical protein